MAPAIMRLRSSLRNIWSNLWRKPVAFPIQSYSIETTSSVDDYWNRHTVNSVPFKTAQESLEYLVWRNNEYPLFPKLMDLYGIHKGETILDYGCGPGNDLVGYLVHSQAALVIGMDVSTKALDLARRRLALHDIDPARVQLVHKHDTDTTVHLENASIDHIYCEGVLHHTSDPEGILREFRRVLRPNGTGCIMVYNRDSLWRHLYVAYVKLVIENAFPGLTVDEAFHRCTDGVECPIAHNYGSDQFSGMCQRAGFAVEYRGGYLSKWELQMLEKHGPSAKADQRLPLEHRDFLNELTIDSQGYPMYRGKHAGIGGVYAFRAN